MYERSLNETERILATHRDVVVPVKEIWLEVSYQAQLQRFEVPPVADFAALLEGDERFEFFPAGDELGDGYVEPTEDDETEYIPDLERLGFYSEDRVRLRNIEVSEEFAAEVTEEPEGAVAQEKSEQKEQRKPARQASAKPKQLAVPTMPRQKTTKRQHASNGKIKMGKAVSKGARKVGKKGKSKS